MGYKIHISVWGNDETSRRIRNAKDLLKKQIENYRGDPRAVWVYTFTRENIDEIHDVMEALSSNGCRATFNMFSAPVGYTGSLRHDRESLARVRAAMMDVMAQYPEHVLYSPYNAVAHTHRLGLHDTYGCSYPRMNPSTDIGLGRSFRQYRADLTWDRSVACCVPDTDCPDCRHYASGSAGRDRASLPPRDGPGVIQGLARLRGHLPRGLGHGIREGRESTGQPDAPRPGSSCNRGKQRGEIHEHRQFIA